MKSNLLQKEDFPKIPFVCLGLVPGSKGRRMETFITVSRMLKLSTFQLCHSKSSLIGYRHLACYQCQHS